MGPNEFNDLVKGFFVDCHKLLSKKEKEYGREYDRLVQFKLAGAVLGVSPIEALQGMMVKHTTRLFMMIEDTVKNRLHNDTEWMEVLHDHVNYHVLLYALLFDLHCFNKEVEVVRDAEEVG